MAPAHQTAAGRPATGGSDRPPIDRLDDRELAAWHGLVDTMRTVRDRLDRELRNAHDLTLDEYGVLVQLAGAPDNRLRMAELADRILMSRSHLTHVVDRMEKSSLVCRERCGEDRRGTWAVLTRSGRTRLEQAAVTHDRGARRNLIDDLSRHELEVIGAALRRIDEQLRG